MDWTATFDETWVVSLLPPTSSTKWETILDLVDGGLVARDPVSLVPLSRSVSDVPLAWLPYLAEERSVDEFSSAWPEARQRAVTAASPQVHKLKGSRQSVVAQLSALEFSAKLTEWFEVSPPRYPDTFHVSLTIENNRPFLLDDYQLVARAANKSKPAHEKLELIEVERPPSPSEIFVGGIPLFDWEIIVGEVPDITEIRLAAILFVGGVPIFEQTGILRQTGVPYVPEDQEDVAPIGTAFLGWNNGFGGFNVPLSFTRSSGVEARIVWDT